MLVRLVDPAGEGLKGTVSLTGIEGLDIEQVSQPVEMKPGADGNGRAVRGERGRVGFLGRRRR